ncbi:S-methyl-5-thioribose-1-phosphate isomerase [Candidatus Bathyarchaeota archaeon]|nr:S-methyl-5-thioribose-1-phosphate isomerase [Candidatus Bathyarchaeota archaeon]
MRTLEWKDGVAITIDQTKLPTRTILLNMKGCGDVASAIKEMKIRGAPLIGVAAAFGLALTAYHSKTLRREQLMKELETSAQILRKTRPTAVNLFWAINRVLTKAKETTGDKKEVTEAVINEAKRMANEDIEVNHKMGEHGSSLVENGDVILTHCNAGGLATVGYGTALGVIFASWEQGKKIRVIATETRPQLQGARLTAYELKRENIPVTLITDNMVGFVMAKKQVNLVIVGADRIVKDAVINKIGTYSIAVLAKAHDIPFYVAAPISTMDLSHTSSEVIIEEREPKEVTHFRSRRIAPKNIEVMNPAFDITPTKYISGIITEIGVLSPEDLNHIKFERYKHY